MELASTITGMVCLALFISPIYYFHQSGKKKKKQIIDSFRARSREMNLTINESEYWNSSVLGIDTQQKKLLYFTPQQLSAKELLVDLRSISKCKAQKTYVEIKSSEGSQKVLDKLLLELVGNGKSAPLHITIYDSQKSNQLNDELQLFEKWAKLINNNLI